MVLPKPVYEALPYLYVSFGLLALAMIESGARFIPGAMLIVAGLIVLHLRFSARHEEALHSRRHSRAHPGRKRKTAR